MVKEWQRRSSMLIGEEALCKLKNTKVAVFGVGGVGGFAVEALVRSGIGKLVLVDKDVVEESNINRQMVALNSTIGKSKVEVAAERAKDINPDIEVDVKEIFFLPQTVSQFDFEDYDYVIDAIDTMSAKLELVKICLEKEIPLVSSMGMGNRLNPQKIRVCDIFETKNCSLAKRMRKELRKIGVKKLEVVASDEEEIISKLESDVDMSRQVRRSPASMIMVPAVAGMMLAGVAIQKTILKNKF